VFIDSEFHTAGAATVKATQVNTRGRLLCDGVLLLYSLSELDDDDDDDDGRTVSVGVKELQSRHHYKSHKVALWNDLIPRLHRPRGLSHYRPTFAAPTSTARRQTSSSSFSTAAAAATAAAQTSTLAAMERDAGDAATAMSAVGQDRKSHERKSHDLPHDADIVNDDAGGSGNDNDVTVSFSLALTVGCALLLLNVVVFVGTMCQWPRLRRRRRRRRKQRHAAALAALTSYPVDGRKLDAEAASPPRAGELADDTRLTLLCAEDQMSSVRAADWYCTRPDDGPQPSNFCDGGCSLNVGVEIESSLTSARSTTDSVTLCNHVHPPRSQFTAV